MVSYKYLIGGMGIRRCWSTQVLANHKLNPLITTWEQIAKVFPPEPQRW